VFEKILIKTSIFQIKINKAENVVHCMYWIVLNRRISHLPEEQKARVRIPPGCKVSGKHVNAIVNVDLICIVCICN
jgi:hypothetical protein